MTVRGRLFAVAAATALALNSSAALAEFCIANNLGAENLVPPHLISRCDAQVLNASKAGCKTEFSQITDDWHTLAEAEMTGDENAPTMRSALRSHVLSWCTRFHASLPVRLGRNY